MIALSIPYPDIDPVIFQLGPLAIRWYSLAYVAGLICAWIYLKRLMRSDEIWGGKSPATALHIDDLLFWGTLGVIIGGRLGSVLFYDLGRYLDEPLAVFAVWQGGMSFHGGLLGVAFAVFVYAKVRDLEFLPMIDAVATAVPIGLFFGRIANFINGELYGRVTDVPWAMVFPFGGPEARHPSQLYEAFLEGLVLFAIIRLGTHTFGWLKRPGLVSGVFVAGYGAARIMIEFAREPDRNIGFLAGGVTMGMALSVPMVLLGVWLIIRSQRNAGQPGSVS